jgi:rhodanese-related sulfurtransferase
VLVAQGYTNVREYVEGKKDWRDAGLALERAGAQPSVVS